MKQYCRYCCNCIDVVDFVDVAYCEKKHKEMSHATAKSVNHCKDFEFNEIDAFNIEKGRYKPREKKSEENIKQLQFDF